MLNRGEMYPFDLIYDIMMLKNYGVFNIQVKRTFQDEKSFKLGFEGKYVEGGMGGFRVSVRRGIKRLASGVIS